jgi:hypothetical protein
MKERSTSMAIKEMQVKTPVTLTPMRMAIFKGNNNNPLVSPQII